MMLPTPGWVFEKHGLEPIRKVDDVADYGAEADAVDGTAAPSKGTCRDWVAIHNRQPPGPARLIVRGTCTFLTTGFSVELRRHEPQGINPRDLLLDRIEHPPTGPVLDVVTDVEVTYEEETDFDYDAVTILPDGPSIPVTEAQ